tara:strand:+ start:1112 stop:2692 length:1581 start_codon:yes stop_codon:yes gene_type:complete
MAAKFSMLLSVKTIGKQAIQRLGNSMQGLAGRVKNVRLTVDGLAKAYASLSIVQDALNVTVQRTESERRLKLLSQGFDDLASVQNAATEAANKFGISQTNANKEFAQIYARLRPIGLELEDIRTVYEGFNTAAKLSGTTASEASGAFLQLSQALGTGVLRGEELNSVFEQTPAIVQAIALEMGVPVGQMRDLAKEGKITIDYILPALERLRTEGADKLTEAMKGPEQQFRNLRIAFDELKIAAIVDNMERILALVNGLTEATESLTNIINAPGFKQTLDLLYKFSSGPLNKLNDIGEFFEPKKPPSLSEQLTIANPEQTGEFIGRYRNRVDELKTSAENLNAEWKKGATDGLKKYKEGLGDISTRIATMVTNSFKKIEDSLVNFSMTGKLAFNDLARSIIRDMTRIAIQQSIMAPFGDWFGGLFKKGPTTTTTVPKRAMGGPVGAGRSYLVGERGPELLRLGSKGGHVTPNHQLGNTSVVVNVDAKGQSQVQGNEGQAAALGRAISAAVTSELVKQKRPGGLLSAA